MLSVESTQFAIPEGAASNTLVNTASLPASSGKVIDASHYPTADDISADSLDYLFNSPPISSTEVPWVNIVSDKSAVQYERQIQKLEEQLYQSKTQIQKLCAFAGYLHGAILEKDELLKSMPDLRVKAAMSIAREIEAKKLHEHMRELEVELSHLQNYSRIDSKESVGLSGNSFITDEMAISLLMWLGLTGMAGVLYTLTTII